MCNSLFAVKIIILSFFIRLLEELAISFCSLFFWGLYHRYLPGVLFQNFHSRLLVTLLWMAASVVWSFDWKYENLSSLIVNLFENLFNNMFLLSSLQSPWELLISFIWFSVLSKKIIFRNDSSKIYLLSCYCWWYLLIVSVYENYLLQTLWTFMQLKDKQSYIFEKTL